MGGGEDALPPNWLGLVPPRWAVSRGSNISRGGGRGSSSSQNKAAFSWPGREWQEGSSGECSQLDRKNWFRMASPANGEEARFPSQNLWHLGGGEYHPRGGTPTALLEGDWAEILMASMLCYPKVVPILPLSSLTRKVGIIQSPQAFCGPGIGKHSINPDCH